MNSAADYKFMDARFSDLVGIQRLMRDAFSKQDSYDILTIAWLLLHPSNINLKVLDATGRLVGHVTGSPLPLIRKAWIVTLGVDPAHWRRGIGWRLLASCEERLRPPTVRLTVRASNSPAIALYERAGYRRVRVWRHYYRGGEDGLIMEKRRSAKTGA